MQVYLKTEKGTAECMKTIQRKQPIEQTHESKQGSKKDYEACYRVLQTNSYCVSQQRIYGCRMGWGKVANPSPLPLPFSPVSISSRHPLIQLDGLGSTVSSPDQPSGILGKIQLGAVTLHYSQTTFRRLLIFNSLFGHQHKDCMYNFNILWLHTAQQEDYLSKLPAFWQSQYFYWTIWI